MTPEAVEDEVRRPARSATPTSPRSSARPPTTCPACPASGPKTAAKWINQYDGLDDVVAHADEIKGKAGEALREHLGDVIRNRRLNALVRDLDLDRVGPTDLAAPAVGPRGGAHALRRPGVPGAARPALRDPRGRRGRRSTTRLRRSTARVLGAGRGRRLAGRARAGAGAARRRAVAAARWGARHRRGRGARARRRRRRGGLARRSTELDPERRGGARRLARRPRRGPRCCTTPRGRCWRWPRAAGRCAGWPATPRSRRTSSGPTSAPTTWPTSTLRYLKRELQAEATPTTASGMLDFGDDAGDAAPPTTAMLRARAVARPRRGARRPSSRRDGGAAAARRGRAAAGRRARADGADRHRRRRRPPRRRWRRTSPAR